jgi:PKD repeat protein
VIDVSDPANLSIVGFCETPGYARDVYVSGNHAYVADGAESRVIDVSNPANPSVIGSFDTPGYAHDVHVFGNHSYVADGSEGLQVIDVSDPASPFLVGSCSTPGSAMGVYISGDYAYVADNGAGLQVIDVSNPASPTIVGSCDTPGYPQDVYVSGDYAYVADHRSGLQVIDVSNPANPSIVGSCDTPDRAWSVYVSGDYAYVTVYRSGLQVIDVSDPASPTIVGSFDTLGYAHGIHVSGNHAYLAADGLQIIDVSNPASPTIVGSCRSPAYGVYVSGNHAYVACRSNGLQVIDVSNPARPTVVGSCGTASYADGVYVSGGHAYVAAYRAGLQVVSGFVPCTETTWLTETEITATVPAGFVPGTYNLHVTNPNGLKGTMYGAFMVTDYPIPVTTDFRANPNNGTSPLLVQFTDESTGTISSWFWDFGDGGTSTVQHPSYTYNNAGDFTVTLTVTGPGGEDTEIKTDYIHVTEPEPTVADFTADMTSGTAPLTVQFTDQSTGEIESWSWSFGDGGNSQDQHPLYTYNAAGDYTVSLTVTGSGGSDTETKMDYIHVAAGPHITGVSPSQQEPSVPGIPAVMNWLNGALSYTCPSCIQTVRYGRVRLSGENFGTDRLSGDQVRIGDYRSLAPAALRYDTDDDPYTVENIFGGVSLYIGPWGDDMIGIYLYPEPGQILRALYGPDLGIGLHWLDTWLGMWVVKDNGGEPVASNVQPIKVLTPLPD